jgi:hypothetical protein
MDDSSAFPKEKGATAITGGSALFLATKTALV